MKKALIVIILLAVLGSAAYVIINRQQPGGEDLFSSLTSKIGGSLGVTTGQAEFPQGSYLKNVGENVLLSASLNPRNFDHLLNKLAAFRDKLVQSSVGKKFNLEEMLNMVISTQVPVDPEGAMQEQGFALAKAIWGSLSDFSLALSSKTFALPDKIEVPMVLVAASMSDDKLLNKAATILDQKVLEGQNAVMVEGIKIEKVAGQERSYKFSVEEGPSSVVGSLQINPGQARLLVGTTDEKEFLASEGGAKPLAQSALWAKAGLGVLPTAALFVLADSSKLSGMVSKLFQSAAGELTDQEAKQGFDMMFSGWADADSFSFSMSFDKGFKLRQCAAMKPDSTTAKLYQAVIKDKEDLVATKKPGFERLISDKSIFALRVPLYSLDLMLEMMANSYRSLAQGDSPSAQEWQMFLAQLESAKQVAKSLPYDEMGLVIDSPSGAPFPEGYMYLGGSKAFSLDDFKNTYLQLQTLFKAQLQEDVLPELKETQGKHFPKLLEVTLDMGIQVVAASVNDKIVMLGLSEDSLVKGQKSLDQENRFLTSEALAKAGIERSLSQSDFYYYLSTASLIEMGKPFLPMLMMQQPEIPVSMEEIDEILDLLKAKLVAVSDLYQTPSSVACTDTTSVIMPSA